VGPNDTVRCSIAQALGEIGERWTLLIVREAVMGSTRFDEFHERLGVARNILADRLETLVAQGVMERQPSPDNARIHHYRLTDKGRDLLPVLAALMHWGDRWLHAQTGPPIVLVDRKTRHPIKTIAIATQGGKSLGAADVAITAGPGATPMMRARLSAVDVARAVTPTRRR
jgi:DNA-binding HxlR family transcriptional regulator